MVSRDVFDLCRESSTVSSKLLESPTATPADVYKTLYNHSHGSLASEPTDTAHDVLERAAACGRWPGNPSRLFLQAFGDALKCLHANPLVGMVSPPLMGSHGTIPLTIIAPLAEVARHCAEMIKQARREVFFVTCVWTPSESQGSIKNALVELSKRAGARGEKVAVRIIYDQASPWHAFESHMKLKPEAYDNLHVQLPRPEEIPNLDLQVVSLHTMFLGTLHAKYCVVDNRVALVMSNNIENNQNLEMLTHLEGPVVASIRDSALITWGKSLGELSHQFADTENDSAMEDEVHQSYLKQLVKQANMRYGGDDLLEATNNQLNAAFNTQIQSSGPPIMSGHEMTPLIWTQTGSTVPIALVSRPAYGGLDHGDTNCPQNEAWLSLVRGAERDIFIQTPDLNAEPMISALADALARGVQVTYYFCFGYNDCGEMIPGQGGTNEQAARKLMALARQEVGSGDRHSLKNLLRIHAYVAKDQDHPIHHSFRQRDCHLKLLIVDEAVGVQGSGNQDTQSWCHSQEFNIMVDSREVCAKWRQAIERNQRTAAFGRLAEDGIWRGENGQPGQGYSGDPGMVGGLLKGVVGMANKTLRQRFGAHE